MVLQVEVTCNCSFSVSKMPLESETGANGWAMWRFLRPINSKRELWRSPRIGCLCKRSSRRVSSPFKCHLFPVHNLLTAVLTKDSQLVPGNLLRTKGLSQRTVGSRQVPSGHRELWSRGIRKLAHVREGTLRRTRTRCQSTRELKQRIGAYVPYFEEVKSNLLKNSDIRCWLGVSYREDKRQGQGR